MDSLAEYAVSVSGRIRKARLLRINRKNTALIELDGKVVEITFSDSIGSDEKASINVNGKNHKVKLSRNDRLQALDVEVDGKLFVLQLEAKRKELNNKTSTAIVSPSFVPKREKLVVKKHGAVTSLMPGKVVLLKVKTGDKVKVGDPLCVLEAMKMENEIVAPRDGTVTQVNVEQGSVVNKSDVLVVIK
jgi:biotin carboxyl carrier protein